MSTSVTMSIRVRAAALISTIQVLIAPIASAATVGLLASVMRLLELFVFARNLARRSGCCGIADKSQSEDNATGRSQTYNPFHLVCTLIRVVRNF